MQMKQDFYSYYNKIEYNHDFVISLKYKYIYISMYMCKSTFQKR